MWGTADRLQIKNDNNKNNKLIMVVRLENDNAPNNNQGFKHKHKKSKWIELKIASVPW